MINYITTFKGHEFSYSIGKFDGLTQIFINTVCVGSLSSYKNEGGTLKKHLLYAAYTAAQEVAVFLESTDVLFGEDSLRPTYYKPALPGL